MIAIVTIDDNNGMMFNKRRQSKDIRLIERILDIAGTNRIWVSEYSSQLFDTSKDNIIVDNSYTEAQAHPPGSSKNPGDNSSLLLILQFLRLLLAPPQETVYLHRHFRQQCLIITNWKMYRNLRVIPTIK